MQIQGILDSRDDVFHIVHFQRILTKIVRNEGTTLSFLFLVRKKSILNNISFLQKEIFKFTNATNQTKLLSYFKSVSKR
jgi:hypothetical protein